MPAQALLNYGFRFFESRKLWEAGEVIADQRVWKGETETTSLVVREPVYVAVPRGSFDTLETRLDVPANIMAPLSAEQPVGEVRAVSGVDTVAAVPVYSAVDVPEGSLLSTAWDELLLWFE